MIILKKKYKLIAFDLSKQNAVDAADPRAIQHFFLLIRQLKMLWFIKFLKNQKKQYYDSLKEQQKVWE